MKWKVEWWISGSVGGKTGNDLNESRLPEMQDKQWKRMVMAISQHCECAYLYIDSED